MNDIVYVCNKCDSRFSLDEADWYEADEGSDALCPDCGSNDLEEGTRCKVCRDIHAPNELNHGVCKSCFQDAVDSYKSCIAYLMPWEREVLEEEYGTIDITERDV